MAGRDAVGRGHARAALTPDGPSPVRSAAVTVPLPNRLAAEAIGTFALVFAGCGAVVVDGASGGAVTHVGVAVTWGLVVMAAVYALGDVSGAHLNPAVTGGFWLAGRFPGREVAGYVAAQLLGATGAALLLRGLFGLGHGLGATAPAGSDGQSLVLEIVLTAGLMGVILCVSTGPKEVGVMAGIAVGGTVGLEALFAGPICGASMNPARSIGPALASGDLTSLWVYVAGPLVGAAVAVPLWRLVRPGRTTPGQISTNSYSGSPAAPTDSSAGTVRSNASPISDRTSSAA